MPYNAGMPLQNFKSVISILAIAMSLLTCTVGNQAYTNDINDIPAKLAEKNLKKKTCWKRCNRLERF